MIIKESLIQVEEVLLEVSNFNNVGEWEKGGLCGNIQG